MSDSKEQHASLKRQVGLWGAVFMGLGAMIGTGVFVSIGIAAGIAGPSVILAVALAAVVAACNGLSSAQLAAAHPVSGGTYEYGYKYLTPQLGFTAGWMFLIAKSASAATAALGAAGYLIHSLGWNSDLMLLLGPAVVVVFMGVVSVGIHRSNQANMAIVSVTLCALALFVCAGLPDVLRNWSSTKNFEPFFVLNDAMRFPYFGEESVDLGVLSHAIALMFVAYTGYGRIATLGEEVREPARTIPRAVIVTLALTAALYVSVAFVAIGLVGADAFNAATAAEAAPLAVVAEMGDRPWLSIILSIGAITAMFGVLLNLILGLSRVLLAMGRRRDMPSVFARVSPVNHSPQCSVVGVSVIILAFTLLGDIKLAWSFSAFTVLVYYSITNLAALRMPPEERRYPRWISKLGLASCLFLAFQVDARTWQIGLGLIALGLGWHTVARGRRLGESGNADAK